MSKFKCKECGNTYFKKFKECPQCEVALDPITNTNKQTVKGDANQTIQVGGNNSGDIIVQHSSVETNVAASWHHETIKPIMLGSVQPKLNWLAAGSGLGLLVSITTLINQVITFFKSFGSNNFTQVMQSSPNNLFFIYGLLGLSFFLGFVYIAIRRFNNFNFFGKSIQAGEDGKLFFTKIVGICDVCNSPSKLGRLRNESAMVCSKNPNHSTPFDWTFISDISEEYKRRTNSK